MGAIYAVVAIGFNLVYSTTGILNFAQGEFVMLGGMAAVTFLSFMPLPMAIMAAIVTTTVAAGLIEVCFLRRLQRHTLLHMIIITIGLSILIREAALHIWDEKVRSLPYFTGNESSSVGIWGASVSPQTLWVVGTVLVVVTALYLFFRCSMLGKAMRACSSNPQAAMLCGVNTSNMRTLSFAVSGALGALAGCVISPMTMSQYDMGTGLAIKGFAAAMLGGLGNPMAGIAGGLIVGLAEAFSVSVLPAAYKDAVAFTILLCMLFVRPHGLFAGRSAIGREA